MSEGWINGGFFVLEPGLRLHPRRRRLRSRATGEPRRRGPAEWLLPRGVLAVHGHGSETRICSIRCGTAETRRGRCGSRSPPGRRGATHVDRRRVRADASGLARRTRLVHPHVEPRLVPLDAGLETPSSCSTTSRGLAAACCADLHVRGGAGETKCVRCARGRSSTTSSTRGRGRRPFVRVERFELDDVAHQHLYLAPFIAHGFQVVSDEADVCYLHSRPYEPDADLAVAWNDPSLSLAWPIAPPVLSGRDASAPTLAEIDLDAAFERSVTTSGRRADEDGAPARRRCRRLRDTAACWRTISSAKFHASSRTSSGLSSSSASTGLIGSRQPGHELPLLVHVAVDDVVDQSRPIPVLLSSVAPLAAAP